MPTKRNYKREYAVTDSKPAARKKRSDANKARRKLGLKKGDPRHAGHVKRGGGNGKKNIRAENASKNMSKGGKVGNKAGKARGGRNSKRS